MSKWLVVITRTIMVFWAMAISFCLVYFALDLFIQPVTIVGLEMLTPQITVSNPVVKYRASYVRHKECKATLDRFVTADLGTDHYRIVYREEFPGTQFLGPYTLENEFRLPGITPGTYEFRQYLNSWCPFVTRVDAYPVRTFKVVP